MNSKFFSAYFMQKFYYCSYHLQRERINSILSKIDQKITIEVASKIALHNYPIKLFELSVAPCIKFAINIAL